MFLSRLRGDREDSEGGYLGSAKTFFKPSQPILQDTPTGLPACAPMIPVPITAPVTSSTDSRQRCEHPEFRLESDNSSEVIRHLRQVAIVGPANNKRSRVHEETTHRVEKDIRKWKSGRR